MLKNFFIAVGVAAVLTIAGCTTTKGDPDTVALSSDVLFGTNKANLDIADEPTLNYVVDRLNKEPNIMVRVAGYTDNVGSADYNLQLSKRRAQAVADYLVAHGVSRDRLYVTGYGEEYPVQSNALASGRNDNRRVEITFRYDDFKK